MKIIDARCTNCGASLSVETQKTLTECEYCHSTIMVSDAVELALVEVDKTKDIKSYRENLKKAVTSNSIAEIKRLSELLRDIVPDDFAANYYYGYALASLGDVKFLRGFYESPKPGTDEAIDDVVNHLFTRSDLRDKARIIPFLNQVAPNQVSVYEKMHAERVQVEDLYAAVPKDVFVCFSSFDRAVAEKAVKTLEADGYTCWISTRNLRPDDAENYWKNIKTAIHNARTVIVISSQHAMISKDVQEEIETAQKAKKPLFEYKIDQAPHTVLFKHVFNGIKWVDGTENPLKQIDKLPKRVFEELKNAPEIKKPVLLTDYNPPKTWVQKFIIPIIIIALIGVSGVVAGMSGVFAPAEYTVEFIDYDGVTIETQTLEEGLAIPYPSSPDRDGYKFTGWSSEPETATQDVTLRAEYERKTYDVTFEDYDGTVLSSVEVTHGSDVELPDAPTRTGYRFMGWEGSTNSIEENQTLTATYEILTFTVRFNNHNGELLKQEIVEYGQDANPPEVQREGYDFMGWNQSLENITDNLVVNPIFEIKSFSLNYLDSNGELIASHNVKYGEKAPRPPSREGYKYDGIIPEFVTGNIETVITYSLETFAVIYKDIDGSIIASYVVNYQEKAPIPNDPIREGLTFTGWTESANVVTENKEIYANYRVEGPYSFDLNTGTLMDYDNSLGEDIVIPSKIGGIDVKHIGENAFQNNNLRSIVIPDSVISIGIRAFSSNNLTTVSIPSSVENIQEAAFSHNMLTQVNLNEGVTIIDSNAFYDNELSYITIPSSVDTIGGFAFAYNKLMSLLIRNGVSTIEFGAFTENNLRNVTIPSSVSTIGSSAFSNNEITSINISDGVEYINSHAFSNNAIISVTIPESLVSIGGRAFENNEIISISIEGDATRFNDDWEFIGFPLELKPEE